MSDPRSDDDFGRRLRAADPTLRSDGEDVPRALPEDRQLRDEVLRQQLLHGLLLSEALEASSGDGAGAPSPEGSETESSSPQVGSPGLELLLADLPPRQAPHPGAWAVLRGPVLLVTFLFVLAFAVRSLTEVMGRTPETDAFAALRSVVDPAAAREFEGRLTVRSKDADIYVARRFLLGGDDRFRVCSAPESGAVHDAGFDGARLWFASAAHRVIESPLTEGREPLQFEGFPLDVLCLSHWLRTALEHSGNAGEGGRGRLRLASTADSLGGDTAGTDREVWTLTLDELPVSGSRFLRGLELTLDPETGRPERMRFELVTPSASYRVQVGDLREVEIDDAIYQDLSFDEPVTRVL